MSICVRTCPVNMQHRVRESADPLRVEVHSALDAEVFDASWLVSMDSLPESLTSVGSTAMLFFSAPRNLRRLQLSVELSAA